VVAFAESPDPLVKPVITGGNGRSVKLRNALLVDDRVTVDVHDSKQSDPSYILFLAANINLNPLATRDLRSPSMNNGDYIC
jgi:hypothetical protein